MAHVFERVNRGVTVYDFTRTCNPAWWHGRFVIMNRQSLSLACIFVCRISHVWQYLTGNYYRDWHAWQKSACMRDWHAWEIATWQRLAFTAGIGIHDKNWPWCRWPRTARGAPTNLRSVFLESFVCQTTYRWSNIILSINKEGRNSRTWIKPAIAAIVCGIGEYLMRQTSVRGS